MCKKISSFIILLIVFVAFSMPFSYSQAEESSSIWLEPQKYKVFGLDKSGKIEFKDNDPGIALKEIKEVKDAINVSPSWLKDELTKQFYDMFRRPIDIGENATIATGDINGDGYPDIIAGGKNTLTIFINSKTPFTLSLLKLKSIEFPDFANKEINPSLFDMDNDGFCDLIVGVENKVYLLKNEASKETPTFKSPEIIFESQIEDSSKEKDGSKENLTPSVFKLENDIVIVLGNVDGTLNLLKNVQNKWIEDKDFFKVWKEKWSDEVPWENKGIVVPGNATPSVYPLNDGSYLLAIGSGIGTLKTYRITKSSDSYVIQNFDIIPQFEAGNFLSPAFIDVNGDTRVDLLLGLGDGTLSYILNYGSVKEIKFLPLNSGAEKNPLNDFFGGPGYFRPYDPLYAYGFNEDQILKVANFINGVDKAYLDEVLYCVANFQVEDLLAYAKSDLLNLLVENAKDIYEMSEKLHYVKIKEYPDYTTLLYATNDGFKEMPKEIYYKYLVMLNRYLCVPTRYKDLYEENFYRTFLPYDTLYGKTLFDAVKDSKTLYDAAYNVDKWLRADIGGIWHTGEKPAGWYNIYKNLLNKDKGIWCGEWSIIYEAAARAVNIPTIIIVALGEDHQFNNFWADGWHHIDASSGTPGEDGSWKEFFDDSLIYYRQWGGRIFSWPMEWEGDGKYDHVWRSEAPYNPPELLSDLTFYVTDKSGLPIDGARVELWSHWPMEGEKPYSTVPFISAIGYTDSSGYVTIKNVGHQDFTAYVVSRIGSVNFFLGLKEKKGGKYSFNAKIHTSLPELFKYKGIPKPNFDPTPKKVELILRIGSPYVTINNEVQPALERAPFINNGRTMVPLRLIVEAFGAEVTWDEATKGITIKLSNKVISMQVNNTTATINGEKITLDTSIVIKNGRTFVPIRFIAENFGSEVIWDKFTETITILYYIPPNNREVKINLETKNFVQGNYHWIDAYNTSLKYIDYWKQDKGDIDILILSEEEFHNFLLGLNVDRGDFYKLSGLAANIINPIPEDGSYCVVVFNPGFATSIEFKIK